MRQEVMGFWGWQWHELDHMQTICTSLQTDNLSCLQYCAFTSCRPAHCSIDEYCQNIVECKNYTVRSVVVVCGEVLNDMEETSANYPPTVFFTGDGEGGNCGI